MLRVHDTDRVRLVTLDRPEALNAFNDQLYDEGRDALRAADNDPAVAVVVLTGAGRAFSAGQDLSVMAAARPPQEGSPAFYAFMDAVCDLDKPLLAAVNGVGVGIGATILGHCDIVVVADTARLRAPFTRLGVVPEAASSLLFPALMGWQRAAHFLLTAEWLEGQAIVDAGLAWKCVAAEVLIDETLGIARSIAAMPISSLVGTKRLLKAARADAISAARSREDDAFIRMVGEPPNLEAISAFLEKRDPDFSKIPGA